MGYVGHSVMLGSTTVGMLVGGVSPWPCWLMQRLMGHLWAWRSLAIGGQMVKGSWGWCQPAGWWVIPQHKIGQKDDSKIVFISSTVLLVECILKMATTIIYLPRQSLCPASLGAGRGGVPSLASMSDPGFFQIAFSALELRAGEILHTPFKTGISVSYSSQVLLCVSPYGLKIQILGGVHLSSARFPELRLLMQGSNPFLPMENLCNCDYTLICGLPA